MKKFPNHFSARHRDEGTALHVAVHAYFAEPAKGVDKKLFGVFKKLLA